jgi:hypothetical protein
MNKPGSFRRLVRNLRKQAESKKPASNRREKARDAAEDVCRKIRADIVKFGFATSDSVDYLFRWMQLSGKHKYDDPKPLKGKDGR